MNCESMIEADFNFMKTQYLPEKSCVWESLARVSPVRPFCHKHHMFVFFA